MRFDARLVTSISSTLPRAFRPSRRTLNGRLHAVASSLAIERHARGFAHITQVELPRVRALRGRVELHAITRGARKALRLGVIERGPARKRAHACGTRQHRPALDELETPLALQCDARSSGLRVTARVAPCARPSRARCVRAWTLRTPAVDRPADFPFSRASRPPFRCGRSADPGSSRIRPACRAAASRRTPCR